MGRNGTRQRVRQQPGCSSTGSSRRAEDEDRSLLDRLGQGPASLRSLDAADAGFRSTALLAAQRSAGNAAVQRMISATRVQREDDPAPSGTVVADKPPKLSIPYGSLGAYPIKPLALKPWVERDLTPEGATVTAGVELEDFWTGKLFKLPKLLSTLRFLPKIGAGVEVKQFDWGTGAVKPKVGAKLIDLGLRKLLKGVDFVGEISATADSVTPSAGIDWRNRDVTVGVRGEVEGEVGRHDPASHRSTWEWVPKATLKVEFSF